MQSPARRNVSAGGVASVASKKPELTASGSSTAVKATTPPRCNPGKPSSAAEQESRQSLHNSTTVVKDEDQESRRSRQFNTAHVDDKDQVFSRPRPKGPALAEGEDAFLIMHMSNIQENAELLTKEGALLAQVQRPGRTADDIDRYATALEEILEQKEDMILDLRRMDVFKEHLLHREKLGPSK